MVRPCTPRCSRRVCLSQTSLSTTAESDYLRLVDTLDHLKVDSHARKATPIVFPHPERAISMPILSLSTSGLCDTTTDISTPEQDDSGQTTYVVLNKPVRNAVTLHHSSSLMIEIQTPLQVSAMSSPQTLDSVFYNYQAGGNSLPAGTQRQNISAEMEDIRHMQGRQQVEELRTCFLSFTSEVHTSQRQRWSSKVTAGIKHWARVVAGATKRATCRYLRSAKKLRVAARYIAPVATTTRNPYETTALA